MSNCAEWIEDMLGAAKESQNPEAIRMIECCGKGCAARKNADMLCECTRGHEKAVWSNFFGKPIEVELVESFLRGGNDCVLKIVV